MSCQSEFLSKPIFEGMQFEAPNSPKRKKGEGLNILKTKRE